MSVDYCLLLSAGLGTRMGPVGTVLPKVMWPIFEKTLLELQINYIEKFKPKKIFINTHHLADEINFFIKKNTFEIENLYEEKLLDIGGAVHNLARKLNYEGNLLLINSDQFLFTKDLIDYEFIPEKCVELILICVEKSKNYGQILLDSNARMIDLKRGENLPPS